MLELRLADGAFAVDGLTDDLVAVDRLEERAQPTAYDRVVVGEHDSDAIGGHSLMMPRNQGKRPGNVHLCGPGRTPDNEELAHLSRVHGRGHGGYIVHTRSSS